MTSSPHPFNYLEALEQSASLYSAPVPEAQEDEGHWQGVSFLLSGQHYTVPLGAISEILPVPKTTPLPGVQHWVKGIANVRGKLIPIVSLGEFLDNQAKYSAETSNLNNRILVVEKKDLSVGLIVDEVQGMLQFASHTLVDEIPVSVPESVRPFTRGSYSKDRHYVVFSVEGLVTNERFLKAASY